MIGHIVRIDGWFWYVEDVRDGRVIVSDRGHRDVVHSVGKVEEVLERYYSDKTEAYAVVAALDRLS